MMDKKTMKQLMEINERVYKQVGGIMKFEKDEDGQYNEVVDNEKAILIDEEIGKEIKRMIDSGEMKPPKFDKFTKAILKKSLKKE